VTTTSGCIRFKSLMNVSGWMIVAASRRISPEKTCGGEMTLTVEPEWDLDSTDSTDFHLAPGLCSSNSKNETSLPLKESSSGKS
jgi:hypothetical protein